MFKVLVDYPSYDEELVVVQRVTGAPINLKTLLSPEDLVVLQRRADSVYVDPRVIAYAATLVHATRQPAAHGLNDLVPVIQFGASPRASINLVAGARALAFIRGRTYAVPQDVADLAPEVLRHRLVLAYESIASGKTSEAVIAAILQRHPAPRLELGDVHGR
jgi:MoxR-like ATPase